MRNKRGWSRVISCLIIICIVIGGTVPYITNAEILDDSSSWHEVYDSDGETVLTVLMKDGIITIVAKANAATSNIRWETIGLTFTEGKINTTTTAKDKVGPGSVSDASGQSATLYFSNAANKIDSLSGDTVTTTITFSAEQVNAAFQNKLDHISKGTVIYLHGIFRTYDYDNGTKTTRTGNIKNWKDIMNAEWWGNETLNDFKKYYNMEIEFMPDQQDNTIIFETNYGTQIKTEGLDSKLLNETVSWTNKETEITKWDKTYELIGSYVTKKNDLTNNPYEVHNLADGWTLNKIRSGSTKVPLGGVNVHLVYEQQKKQPNTLYYESESGTTIKTSKPLDDEYVGSFAYWKDEPAVITKNGKTYDLLGYYVSDKNDSTNKRRDENDLSQGISLASVQSNKTKVVLGGVNVHLVYRQRGTPTPTPTPSVTGTVTPTQTPTSTPAPSPTPIAVPEEESLYASMNTPVAIGTIRADDRGNEKFTVNAGVPTTESLYTQVQATEYLMGYRLQKKVGIESYAVKVTKDFNLEWKGKNATGEITLKDTISVETSVTIQRAYGYWEIQNFDLYKIGSATILNYALPNESTTMIPKTSAGYDPPSAATIHSSTKADHIIIPNEIVNGIKLPAETISGGKTKPTVPKENYTVIADGIVPNLKVKNDTLIIDGTVVMDATPTETEGPGVNATYLASVRSAATKQCNENVLYKPGQIIEATKKNGTYHSSGTIAYSRVASVNSTYNTEITSNIGNLSSVVLHTPVLCNPVVTADNDKYVQLLKPTSAVQLVLDSNSTLNDFTVFISNFGPHSSKQGYYTRDFSRSLRDPNVSYIATEHSLLRNEVKFSFDVYIHQASGVEYVKKNTWVVLGRGAATFHLPMWVVEGTYTVACRTIAVNADPDKLVETAEERVNSKLFNYVATNTFKVEVSGRIYGLSIYDLTDYPMWKEAFRVEKSLQLKINNQTKYPDGTNKTTYSKGYSYNYTVGTNDSYGNDTNRNIKYTFPLVNGSHPFYKNIGVLKTGYVVRFKLNTVGTMYSSGNSVKMKPTFYYVDANGKNRTAVDIYYEEAIDGKNRKMVKMGNALDQINLKTMEAGSPYTGIPTTEMIDTASILKMEYGNFISKRDSIFTFKDIRIPSTFRTFVNKKYTNTVVSSDQYSKIQAEGITKDTIMKQMQSWYGCYYLPGIMHAAPLGYQVYDYASKYGVTYKEDFWKTDGYIIVNLDIVTIDSEGKERLSYINASNYANNGNSSMWVTEGAPLIKTDNKNVAFHFKAGDFIIYYTDESVQDDYSPGGIY